MGRIIHSKEGDDNDDENVLLYSTVLCTIHTFGTKMKKGDCW